MPDLHRPLRVGDRVHLLNENQSDGGDAIWQISGLTVHGTFEITPISETLVCPQIDRLVRAPLVIGDIVSVFQHTVETGIDGTQVFGQTKVGFGAVSKCYVVDGKRKYDVLSQDAVYGGSIFTGLDDTEIGMFDLGDQMGVAVGSRPVQNPFVGHRVVGDIPAGNNATFGGPVGENHFGGPTTGNPFDGQNIGGPVLAGYAPVGDPLPGNPDFGNPQVEDTFLEQDFGGYPAFESSQ